MPIQRHVPDDNAETSRALMVHMLHELLRIQTDIAAAQRHFEYTCRQGGADPHDPAYVTPVALDVAHRAVSQSIEATGYWLKGQVIGLYGSKATTDAFLDGQERERDEFGR